MRPDPARHAVQFTDLRPELREGIDELELALTSAQVDALLSLAELLMRWNHVYNLTSIRDPRDILAVHLLDSLSVVKLVESETSGSVLDVGTGPGFPGLPLAIALPQVGFDLVDAVSKKVSFIKQAKSSLGLANVVPHHARIEALALVSNPSLIVSRAFADLTHMLQSIDRLAGADTTIVAMKGVVPHDEIAAVPEAWTVVETRSLNVPRLGAQRCAVILRRNPAAGH